MIVKHLITISYGIKRKCAFLLLPTTYATTTQKYKIKLKLEKKIYIQNPTLKSVMQILCISNY